MSPIAYTIYALLVIALIVQPHIFAGHVFGIQSPYAQSGSTALMIAIAGVVYILHRRDITKRELAKAKALKELEDSTEKLKDSFEYIARVNRRLPLLKEVTTDLLTASPRTKKDKQKIFEHLLATAVVSLSRAESGRFRFIEMKSGRTVKEFLFPAKKHREPTVPFSNRAILELRTSEESLKRLDDHYVLPTTHRDAPVQCHYIFPTVSHSLEENRPVLQNIIDQSQVVYKYLYG